MNNDSEVKIKMVELEGRVKNNEEAYSRVEKLIGQMATSIEKLSVNMAASVERLSKDIHVIATFDFRVTALERAFMELKKIAEDNRNFIHKIQLKDAAESAKTTHQLSGYERFVWIVVAALVAFVSHKIG